MNAPYMGTDIATSNARMAIAITSSISEKPSHGPLSARGAGDMSDGNCQMQVPSLRTTQQPSVLVQSLGSLTVRLTPFWSMEYEKDCMFRDG